MKEATEQKVTEQINLITKTPTANIVVATKWLVDALIELDTHNRRKKQNQIDYLCNEINRGEFILTNQGIGVTSSGWLSDGGHRLEAIRKCGYPPVQFLLVTGLSLDAQPKTDTHAKRSMCDILNLMLDSNMTHRFVAILRMCYWSRNNFGKMARTSANEIAELAIEMGDTVKSLHTDIKNLGEIRAPALAAFVDCLHHSNTTLKSRDEIINFISSIVNGVGLIPDTPAYVCNRFIAKMRGGVFGGVEFQKEVYCKVLNCCDSFLLNKPLTKTYGQEKWTAFKYPYKKLE